MKRNAFDGAQAPAAPTAEKLLRASVMTKHALLEKYRASLDGFGAEEAAELRAIYGRNELSRGKRESPAIKFLRAFVNPFTIVLIAIAAVSFVTDVMMAAPGSEDISTVVIICVMVAVSGLLRFVQETRADRAAEKLKEMVHTTASVRRGFKEPQEIPMSEIVPGDIVSLAAGDMVPADLRVLSCKDLFVNQAALTGESEPVEKSERLPDSKLSDPLTAANLVFMGTSVVSGMALCLAVSTGSGTYLGSIAKSLNGKPVQTNFDKGVNSVSWLLIRFMLCMTPVVLFVNGFTKGDWTQAFLFALSIAVGLTPEMLPMIVTTGLARGAAAMAKKKTVVKRLNAIQNFGAMDVLCTDKTGTITQDRVVLEKYLDVNGREDERVLRHAFLNSYYQTNLKNLMDAAVLEHAKSEPCLFLKSKYVKVDEIPFDFNRRRMSVVLRDENGKTQLISKGAVEEMLAVCSCAEADGIVVPLTPELRGQTMAVVNSLNDDGMRVLAVAQKNDPAEEGVFSVRDESDMVLIGYLAFLDPPKETAAAAISALREYGVAVKVLTGDSEAVASFVCRKVGIPADGMLLGADCDSMSDAELSAAVEKASLFAKLSPQQKARIVTTLRNNGHTVGFLGDGINDAAAMRAADVGVSVDTAADVAKESADIILLEKDLMVLENGVLEGRSTFGNIIKYIKLTASSNFGNMLSVLAACAFLPFLPMQPIQLVFLNMLYDFSCVAISWDRCDDDFLKVPRKWDASSIGGFMLWFGPDSSLFDIATFLLLYFVVCPYSAGGAWGAAGTKAAVFTAVFNTGWFLESLCTQTIVIHMIRTPKVPFLESSASAPVMASTVAAVVLGLLLPLSPLGRVMDMAPVPPAYYLWLPAAVLCYMLLTAVIKKVYIRRYGELL